MTTRSGIYIASKTTHAPKWRALREAGVPIVSTWIDEAGPGETASLSDLWHRCVAEASSAAALVVYAEEGEMLKGGLVEVGVALGNGAPVFVVGAQPGWSFAAHPLVTKCASIEVALQAWRELSARNDEVLEKRVNHPSWYTSHASGIECIDLIEHLPCNLANAVKYIWRCGLKQSETPLRDLMSARWYTVREDQRRQLFELDEPLRLKTDVVWRSLARKVMHAEGGDEPPASTLGAYLYELLGDDFDEMLSVLDTAIEELKRAKDEPTHP